MYQYTSASLHLFSFFLLYFFRILQWIFTNSYFLLGYFLTILNKSFLFSGYKWVQSYRQGLFTLLKGPIIFSLCCAESMILLAKHLLHSRFFLGKNRPASICTWRIIIYFSQLYQSTTQLLKGFALIFYCYICAARCPWMY